MRGKTLPDVKQRADMRVREGGDGAGLALEARAAFRVCVQVGGKKLERNRATEARVAGLVDLAHTPGADQPENFVRPQARTRSQRHRRSWPGLYAVLPG